MTDAMFRWSDEAIFADIGQDIVALHTRLGRCYGMEKVTAAVWKLLAQPVTLDSICEKLVEQYDVDYERCRAEVGALLEQCKNEGLVVEVAG